MTTLRKLIENLNKIASDNPEALDLPVIYAKSDEWNEFSFVKYAPTQVKIKGTVFTEVTDKEVAPDAVCIN